MKSDYIDIIENAYQYTSFPMLGSRVFMSWETWDKCVRWEESDEEKQGYQEQDTRLHDVLFVLGCEIQSAFNNVTIQNGWKYKIVCIIRDGIMEQGVRVQLHALPKEIEGKMAPAIDYQGYSELEDDY